MIDPLLWLIYLLTNSDSKCVLLRSSWRVHVNTGFSKKDQILIKISMCFKVMELQIIRNFSMKVGDCRDWTHFWKIREKLAHFKFFLPWNHMQSPLFFYSVIFLHKLVVIRKKYAILVYISSATLQYYQILLKSVNIWQCNHENTKANFFRDTLYL